MNKQRLLTFFMVFVLAAGLSGCRKGGGNPWTSSDIGNTAIAGSTVRSSGGMFTVEASGHDIWQTADGFRYVYQQMTGDGEIVARVESIENTNAWAKAGVMIRETLDDDSAHASMYVTPDAVTPFQFRMSAGDTSYTVNHYNTPAPYWVKVVRSGDEFRGYESPDGQSWSQVGGAQTIPMGQTVHIGLALTSHDNTQLNTTVFTDVALTKEGLPPLAAPNLTDAAAGDGEVTLSWDPVDYADGYYVYYGYSQDNLNETPVDAGANTTQTVTGLENDVECFFAVTAYNAAEEGPASNVMSATPSSPPKTFIENIDYNVYGQKTSVAYGNGTVETYEYFPLNQRLKRKVTKNFQDVTIQDLSYTYDAAGNILTITDNVHTATQAFTYDSLGRLRTADGNYEDNGNTQVLKDFVYDQVGNIVEKDGNLYYYEGPVTGGAGPHAVTSLSNGNELTYDANGNMITKTDQGSLTQYVYDTENRLTDVTRDGQLVAEYEYDGDGGRTKKVTWESGSQVVRKFVGSLYEVAGTKRTRHVYLGDQRIASVTNGEAAYNHTDHLGGTNAVLDEAGELKELIEYKPFGAIARKEKYGNTEEVAWFYFTGQRLDDETGLMYYGARYYDPSLGRFITPDTVVPGAGNPQSFNRYSYVLNNPTNRIDPSGHWSWKKFWKAAVAAVVSAVVFVASGGTATPVIAGFWAGMAGGAVSGALNGGGWQGVLQGAAFGAVTGAAFGGIGAWGADKFGSGFGWGMLGAGGAYAGATGNLDSFAGGLTGAYVGLSLASGYLDARYGSLSETNPDQGIRAGVSAEDNENWAFLGVGTTEGKAQAFANENQMSVIYHKSKGILSDLFRAGFKKVGVSGPWAKQSANFLNVAEGKFILAHSEGTLNLGGGIKLAAANGLKFNDTSIKWIGPVISRSTAASLSNSVGAQFSYSLNAGDPIGVFSTFNPVQSAIYGGVGLATMTRYHRTDAYVQ